ncbi:MAG: hypothetical protein ACOYON_13170 [Fimbriimonas sp.]
MFKKAGFALIAVVAMVGCQSGPSVVGKWNSTLQGVPAVYEFSSDGKMTQSAEAMGIKIKATGIYSFAGEDLKITPQTLEAPGLPKAILDMAKGQMNKEVATKVKFTNADEFVATVQGQSQTFTRVKP